MKAGITLLIALLLPAWLGPGMPRAQPALPATLPGGAPVPSLPATTQQEILQRLLDAGAGRGSPAPPPQAQPAPPRPAPSAATPSAATPLAATPPASPAAPDEPFSPIEAFFNARLSTPLRQFGHDSFQGGAQPGSGVNFGAVPEDYIIGRDDELLVTFRGRTRNSVTARVTREGLLLLPEMQPIPAAGRSLRELRADLEARVARELPGSEAFLSIGALRQVAVFVGGEVARPGMVVLSPLSTVLDALIAAGGPRRSGSLRAIRVGSRVVDLYPVIAGEGGPPPDLRILEGERITVPPIGAVVAIGGEVTRPGIYELPAGAATQPLATMLRLAGDTLRPSGHRFLLETTDAEGRRAFREISLRDNLRRGDALLVQPGVDAQAGGLRLSGHVTAPLTRASGGRGNTLRGLLSDPRLVRPDPWLRMAVIWRADPRTRVRRLVPFDLGRLLQGGPDRPLQEGDEVILIGLPDVQWLASAAVQRALRGEAAAGDCPALTTLATAARTTPQRFAHARLAAMPDAAAMPCPQLFLDHPVLLPFLVDNAVLLMGEVRLPGLLPVLEDTTLEALLEAAGGLTENADLSSAELTRQPAAEGGTMTLQRTMLDLRSRALVTQRMAPRDTLRIPRGFSDRESGPVTLAGEFIRPGTYDIRRGERLSEVIARAGGLSPQAFPYGAVLTRESIRIRQQEGFQRSARDLEQGIMQAAAGQALGAPRGTAVDISGAVTAGREMAAALREARAAGRLVVEANPVVLAARPELDILLEPGDLLVMPKRPNDVTVVGSVLNPGSLQFATGWRAHQYVSAAGGAQRFADTSRAFIVLPNGTAAPAGLTAWQAGGPPVPPGSLIVVPQDPAPFANWAFLRDAAGVLSQVAISGAALAVIAREGARR